MAELEIFVDGRLIGVRFHVAHRISGAGYGLDRLHGHTYELRVRLIGKGEAEFLYPFEELMEIMLECVKPLNNKVLLAEGGGNVVKAENGEITYMSADNKRYVLPREDVYILPVREVTAEALALYLLHEVVKRLRGGRFDVGNVAAVELTLWESFERGVIVKEEL